MTHTPETEHRMHELQEQAEKTKALLKDPQKRDQADGVALIEKLRELTERFTPEERMELVGPGLYVAPGRFKQTVNTTTGRARRQVADEVVAEIHHPSGYVEGMRQGNPKQDQMEVSSRQRGGRMTYGSHAVRQRDGLTKMSQEVEWYDAGDHWHLGLAASAWSVADIGERVWVTTLYICKREGRLHQLGRARGNGEEAVRSTGILS